MSKIIAAAVAFVLVLSAGAVHGVWSERWTKSETLVDAAEQIARVPMQFGEWKANDVEADPSDFERAGARGYWMRSYTHARTGDSVLAILMCGRAGKMAVHTPDVCYRGAGYELFDTPAATAVQTPAGTRLGTFFTAEFTKPSDSSAGLRLYWAWSTGSAWEASANPRWAFRGQPLLYKLYVSNELRGQQSHLPSPALEFMQQLLPELQKGPLAPDTDAGV